MPGIYVGLLLLSSLSLPPEVKKFLTCHVDVHLRAAGSNFYLSGEMAMNAEQDLLFLTLYGDNPQHYWYKTNLTVVVAPNGRMLLSVWKWQDRVCELHTLAPDQVPPLSLPSTAVSMGNKTISGMQCEVWRVKDPYAQVEYVDVSVGDGNVYLLESQAWTLDLEKFGVSTIISLSKHNNSEPDRSWFVKPQGC